MVRMPSKPQIHEPKERPGQLHAAGLALMAANKVRRTFRRYDRPRPWSAKDVDRSVDYVFRPSSRTGRPGFRDAGLDPWLRGRHVLELGTRARPGDGARPARARAVSYVAVDRFPLLGSTPDTFYDALLHRLADAPDVWRAVEDTSRSAGGGALRYVLLEAESRMRSRLKVRRAICGCRTRPSSTSPIRGRSSARCAPGAIALTSTPRRIRRGCGTRIR